MAHTYPILHLPDVVAGEDLSQDQYRFVVVYEVAGRRFCRRPNSTTERGVGILQNSPKSGEPAAVLLQGLSKLEAGSSLALGALVKPEYVSAADAGKGVAADVDPDLARAEVVESADNEGDLITVLLLPPAARAGVVSVPITVAANTTTNTGLFAAPRAGRVTRITRAVHTPPADSDGTTTLMVKKYDVVGTADADLLAAADDLEAAVAKTAAALTLHGTPANLAFAAGDYLFAAAVNNSDALNTAMQGGVVTLEYVLD